MSIRKSRVFSATYIDGISLPEVTMGAMALLLSRDDAARRDPVRRMLEAAPHRGEVRELETLGRVAIGVCNEPGWVTASIARADDCMVVLCGSLDNEGEVRGRLRRSGGTEPDPPTPAATLLAAVRHWGEGAIERLRGSFAGSYTDGETVWCFRDQFGARPLFHHDGPTGFYAATEVKQVLAAAPIPREPNMDHLQGLVFGGIERSTAYRGVERVPKRSIAIAGPDPGLEIRCYWDPLSLVETADIDLGQAVEGTRDALDRAVRRVLTGKDVVLLSGGLDSPALAAFAVRGRSGVESAQALTGVYPEYPTVDERKWTQMAADHVGMSLHEFVPDAGSLDDVERWVRLLDGPVDVLSIPEMAQSFRHARELGARTVLTGEIAEMLFGNRAYLLDHYVAHARFGPLWKYLSHLRERGWSRRHLAFQMLRAISPGTLVAAYVERNRGRSSDVPEWIDIERLWESGSDPPTWRMSPRKRWPSRQVSMLEGPGYIFEASEICAAVCGVDCRRPFVDVDLWEFVLSLPAEVKFPDQHAKPLLRRAMRGVLPDRLIDREDKTFFNEYHLDRADYARLRSLLVEGPDYLEGIDYGQIADAVEAEKMGIIELQWARDLARVHAFLDGF